MKRDVEKVIDNYKNGKISLFEASELLDMHPKEFLDVMLRRNKVNAVCSSL